MSNEQSKKEKEKEKPSLIHKILIYLFRNDAINQRQVIVTAFLKTIRDEDDDRDNNFNRIAMALDRINETGYASYNCSPGNHQLNQHVGGILCTLDNTDVNMTIHLKGWDYIKNFIRENEQHKSILDTNSSILATNKSVKELNDLLPKFNKNQLRLTRIAVAVAAISLIAVGVSAYYASRGITSDQLDATNVILQRNEQILDSIRLHQNKIDATLQKAVKDSLYQHLGTNLHK
jgi:hypothetical protein